MPLLLFWACQAVKTAGQLGPVCTSFGKKVGKARHRVSLSTLATTRAFPIKLLIWPFKLTQRRTPTTIVRNTQGVLLTPFGAWPGNCSLYEPPAMLVPQILSCLKKRSLPLFTHNSYTAVNVEADGNHKVNIRSGITDGTPLFHKKSAAWTVTACLYGHNRLPNEYHRRVQLCAAH